jgi:hypothetical protein
MIIPVRLQTEQSVDGRKLPPSLATLGANDHAIIELQGSFEIEGDSSGQPIGILDMSNPVSGYFQSKHKSINLGRYRILSIKL